MSKWYASVFAAVLALGLGQAAAQDKDKGTGPAVSDKIVKQIEKALPDSAPAKPARPRKVLVFTLATGYVHSSIPVGAKAFEMLGQKTGAYTAVISSDPAMFEEDNLKQFDAVLLISTTGEGFGLRGGEFAKLPAEKQAYYERLRKNLLEYVGRGKGLMGIHAAGDSAYEWREYGKLMGGYFLSHPYYDITVKLDDPTSPINAAFKGTGFKFHDEMYVFREEPLSRRYKDKEEPYSRDRLHILLSIDVPNSKIKPGPLSAEDKKAGYKESLRKDDDYAISWIQKVGSGRVFYCSLGHFDETYFNPVIMQHYLAGLQFALGDLECDTTPSNKK
jgi:type 1 glutamine amidotransferase